jgi:hypothetical protein
MELPCRLFHVGDATRVAHEVPAQGPLFSERTLKAFASFAFACGPTAHLLAAALALRLVGIHEDTAFAQGQEAWGLRQQRHIQHHEFRGRAQGMCGCKRAFDLARDGGVHEGLELSQ